MRGECCSHYLLIVRIYVFSDHLFIFLTYFFVFYFLRIIRVFVTDYMSFTYVEKPDAIHFFAHSNTKHFFCDKIEKGLLQ